MSGERGHGSRRTGGGSCAEEIPWADGAQEGVGGEAPRLNSQMVQSSLLIAFGQDVLLDGGLAHQTVDVNWSGLPDSMTAILSLRCGHVHTTVLRVHWSFIDHLLIK
jgi:hypothetical protein